MTIIPTMNYRNHITIEPNKRGGKPCVRGLRITVYEVLEYLASEMTEAEILDDFPELKRLLDRPGGALSGGEQQLLALARALCGKPRLLLLDEPPEGIQPSIIATMSERLHDLRTRYGLSILLVEQNLDFIRGLANRALLIHRGQIGREIPPAALADPTLVEEFIAAV